MNPPAGPQSRRKNTVRRVQFPRPPLSGELEYSPDQNLSGCDYEVPLRGSDVHGHGNHARPCVHGCVRGNSRRVSARGDVRAGAHGHGYECAHGRAPSLHGNVDGSAHERVRAHANACVRAFLP